jgi:hypothetical protein
VNDLALAIAEIARAESGLYEPTLADGLRWEALGLGRVRFRKGRATWER